MFKDQGLFAGYIIPHGYQLIRVHTTFDVQVDRRHKTCVVVDGHFTATPAESVFSGVVLLRDLRMYLSIGELDGMEPWAIDIGNAYLEALTSEKVVSELDQCLETSQDTSLSSTKHCMDYDLVEKLVGKCSKNVLLILDLQIHSLSHRFI